MNEILLRIKFADYQQRITHSDKEFEHGSVSLQIDRNRCFSFDSQNYHYDPRSKVLTSIIGYLSNIDEIKSRFSIDYESDCRVVSELYSVKKGDLIYELDGVFTILVFDIGANKGFIFRDVYGSNVPFYYAEIDETIVFSNVLKNILKEKKNNRQLDMSAVHDFVFCQNHIIPNSSTLVEGVKQLLPGQYLYIDGASNSTIAKYRKDRKRRRVLEFKEHDLLNSIKHSIGKLYESLNDKTISCTLSGGYDTNIILHFLSELSTNPIHAFTIGGKEKNEIPQGRLSASCYETVKHSSYFVGEDLLDSLPHIVWITEGYVNQKGIFLQYLLSKKVSEHPRATIFLGDGADQILDQYSYSKMSQVKRGISDLLTLSKKNRLKSVMNVFLPEGKRMVERDRSIAFSEEESQLMRKAKSKIKRVRFDELMTFILMKSGIFANYFDVLSVYPFLNQDIEAISRSLWKLNESKRFYKEEVTRIVDPRIADSLKKIGGDTDIDYLFEKNQEIASTVLQHDIAKSLLSEDEIAQVAERPGKYSIIILRLLIVFTFYRLFISEKADSRYTNSTFDLRLKDLISVRRS